MKYLRLCFLILTLVVIYSCSDSTKEPKKNEYEIKREKKKELKDFNQNESLKLAKVRNAITDWDSATWFTYHLQETLDTASRPISFNRVVTDIVKKDSVYIIKVHETSVHIFKEIVAEISVNPSMFKQMRNDLGENILNNGCFIFKVEGIATASPKLSTEVDYENGSENTSADLTYDFHGLLVKFQGCLIDYFIYKRD